MDLQLNQDSYGSGDQRWIGSKHGTNNAQTVTLDGAKFATLDETIPSGTPIKRLDTGLYGPVEAAEDTLAGFLFTDQKANGRNQVAPMVWHGLIRTRFLPEDAFDVTTLTAGNPAFVYKED